MAVPPVATVTRYAGTSVTIHLVSEEQTSTSPASALASRLSARALKARL